MVRNPAQWQAYTPTMSVTARVTAPNAGQVIADLGSLPGGIYQVTAMASYGGTADVIDNMSLHLGDRKVCDLPVIPVANSAPVPITLPALVVLSSQDVSIQANAAGGVGTVFRGTLIATPVQSLDPT